ncbi:VPS9 domain-containing protein [Aspergillus homomorphus CBS 101889]|uniref:VPS9 domain protein n=1 Tax=Aspergillus homomorphus (strain CBS 101889) TaxID=1450537 RepID=A0A395HUU2_ASPHC|nr:VPS9 domain protein [Aspergillus homomorphus CBS 101889]RAL11587.1 VPS9 domain protein [Aspergillus homomorphus CBS 101889]
MSVNTSDNGVGKPRLHTARSFPRMDSSDPGPFIRSRAKTVQSVAIPELVDSESLPLPMSSTELEQDAGPDLFEKTGSPDLIHDDDGVGDDTSVLSRGMQNHSEELPIELISLTDRFVNSLTAKVHSSPPTADRVSDRFQEFYERAEAHIATHISALASRINRDPSPYGSARGKSNTPGSDGRQMLTASEVTEKRIARKHLASKRIALEEAVERRACESIYDKLWRHKSTLDEIRDEKLRSKTAALLLVGINLKDLGIELDASSISEEKQKEADEGLSIARDCLANMNDEKYPLGKLQQLAAAHKAIVDALTKLLPSSSSADEILPTLIYCLITSPPEGINIISNLLFIQRFRSSSKMDGETAYCLTNLEAAISFLENVDLSDLRGGALHEDQTKSSTDEPTTIAKTDSPQSTNKDTPVSSVASVTASPELSRPAGPGASATFPRTQSSRNPQQGRLNNLFQPPAKVLGAANDAVRNTADQSLKNIGASLDSSFNFLFGRLKEIQTHQFAAKDGGSPVVPKTLAEARRLVTSPIASESSFDPDANSSREPRVTDRPQLRRIGSKAEDTLLGLVGGQRTPRDRSADSVRTQGSTRKTTISSGLQREESQASPTNSSTTPTPTPLESMRSFGNTLNPLNHIPGMIRSFSRGAPDTPSASFSSPNTPTERIRQSIVSRDSASSIHSISSSKADTKPTEPKVDPPIQRFLQMQNASEMTIADVSTLLEDYKRLAAALSKQPSN